MTTTHEIDTTGGQLALLEVPSAGPARRVVPLRRRLPAKLRLDEQTRRIGLAGVAEARAILAAQAERLAQQPVGRRAELPSRKAA